MSAPYDKSGGGFADQLHASQKTGLILNLLPSQFDYLKFPGSDEFSSTYKQIKKEMEQLRAQFVPPRKPYSAKGKAKRMLNGDLFISGDGFKWRPFKCSLTGDHIGIKKKGKKYWMTILFALPYQSTLLSRSRGSFPSVKMIRLLLPGGKNYDVRCIRDSDTQEWVEYFQEVMKQKYSPEELEAFAPISEQYIDNVKKERKLGLDKFEVFAQVVWKSNPPKVVKSGRATLVVGDEVTPVNIELSNLSLVLLKSRNPEDRDVAVFHLLSLFSIVDGIAAATLQVETPYESHTIRFANDVVKKQWISAINREINGSSIKETSSTEQLLFDSKGYFYSRSIKDNMILQFKGGGRCKLSGDGPWTIGRSRDNFLSLELDPYLSRHHAKVQLFDNVPYIIDLGTRVGVHVNNEKVTCCPLKPGDNVQIAETVVVFRLAKGTRLFRIQSNTEASTEYEYHSSRSAVESSESSFDWMHSSRNRSGTSISTLSESFTPRSSSRRSTHVTTGDKKRAMSNSTSAPPHGSKIRSNRTSSDARSRGEFSEDSQSSLGGDWWM
eukprot:TRINITY_DN12638_c0_g1_i1.p1 TRINITY_DN12638_c0_g1~~TRINITY_DN12638_c0_g1_i1.p1  ORF type:complete len:571 (+),score=85.22 TRINITY_DN12638_c0_g1_i1:63-1715(+)